MLRMKEEGLEIVNDFVDQQEREEEIYCGCASKICLRYERTTQSSKKL